MTMELRSLAVVPTLDPSKYVAGAQQKVAADKAMSESANAVGAAQVQADTKISQAGDVLARLSRQYVDGYASAQRMQSAVNSLSRGIETGKITMMQAQPILDGIFRKYGQLGDGAQFAAKGQHEFANAIAATTARLTAQVSAANAAAQSATRVTAANQNVGGGNFNASNAAFQMQDVAMMAMMGQSPMATALQQGPQIAMIMQQGGGLSALASGLASLVSPTMLITVGLTAASAAAIQYFTNMKSGSAESEEALAKQNEQIGGVAKRWGDALPHLKAYNDELARTKDVEEALAAARTIGNRQYADSRAGMPDLRVGMADVVVTLQQAGAESDVIARFQREFAELKANIESSTATAEDARDVQKALSADILGDLAPAVAAYASQFDTLAASLEEARAKAQKFREEAAMLQFKDGLGPLDQLNVFRSSPFQTEEDFMFERSRRAREAEEQRIGGLEIGGFVPTPRPNDIERLDSGPSGADYIRLQRDRIELLEAEQGALGDTASARARVITTLQVEQEIRRRGLDLHGAEAEAMRANALMELDLIEEIAERRKQDAKDRQDQIAALDQTRSDFRSFLGDLKQGLQSGDSFWESFANAASNAFDHILDRWLDMVANMLFGQPGTANGGVLSGLFGGNRGPAGSGTALDFFPAAPQSAGVSRLLSPANSNVNAAAGGSIADYIRQAAMARGIDPEIALRVARSEGGLKDPFRQGEAMLSYGREESYGPFQLHMRNGGVGVRALQAGIDPRTNWRGGVDYGLDEAARKGWGQWFGAAKVGIGNRDGLENARPIGNYHTGAEAALSKMAASAEQATKGLNTFDGGLVDMAGKLTSPNGPLGGLFGTGLSNFQGFQDGRGGGLGALLGYGGGGAPQGGGGGLGGIFGMLLGFLPKLFGFAEGTDNAPPGYAWVGERGPEIIKFRGGEQVIPNHKLGGGGSTFSPVFNVDARGSAMTKAEFESIARSQSQQAVAMYHEGQAQGEFGALQARYQSQKHG